MTDKPGFAERVRRRELLVGPVVTLPCAEVAELLARCGFDWLFLDAEHGPFHPQQCQPLLQAAAPCPAVIRVPTVDSLWIGKALDCGADGIIAPRVNDAGQARDIINASKYPPLGERGMGLGRAHGYGLDAAGYSARANRETTVILQAETAAAVDNIDDICAVPGIDAILIGPNDLAASLGKPGKLEASVVLAAIERIAESCRRQNITLGIFGADAGAIRPYMDQGFTLIALGVDILFLMESARQQLAACRG